ncbi:uncharacterized protein Z520_07065 [Fonsecaea multimorphosa CBS 102226]|uniref:Fungal lipase-type domain-containing protein n=1 Tax=Fonsecaea multimorphosa CBS 102226 TaxID=1442371 RepID=A0A0D2IIX5_9EURO|nr:uncharacterized protein Z520_07065 [Fonsecaea multimorphosa CBS 102226]KIX96951.1 hypothetical protein Z520_07065 [Fonsecaea multimorphosa CBS 102226]OAL23148.1 hypothetical protein AYO22_06641 [Fonsecaea multimorphosa]
MPFFFPDARKRRKYTDPPAAAAPISPPNPPPYALNTAAFSYEEPLPQWTPQPATYFAPASYPHMTSTLSLPPAQNLQTEYRATPLQPQHTWSHPSPTYVDAGPPRASLPVKLQERIDHKLGDVISLIDEDAFSGSEKELMITEGEVMSPTLAETYGVDRDMTRALGGVEKMPPRQRKQTQQKQTNVFSKLDLYMNSRLPVSLQPFRVYIPTWPLLCLAAQYSNSAYVSPQSSSERKDFVSADGRLGTKAMVIKSIPCDDRKTIVFAIRGTSFFSVRDWGVNLDTEPVSPTGFLDDQGNLCHSGFLRVARAMVKPIAARLRHLLEENPSRTSCSLLITGHSAGGAVASLLYAHMLAETVQSELNILTGCFKRVHCVTFGAPPVSLLPLQKPETADGRLRKCLFHSFLNEGDPVVRAEKAYVKSLVDLLSRPIPSLPSVEPKQQCSVSTLTALGASMSRLDLSLVPAPKKQSKLKPPAKSKQHPSLPLRKLWWDVPPATLSNAGRLVVLRIPDHPGATEADVTASLVKDEQLRQVVFGDPLVHSMNLYATRIETLAVRAVTGRGGAC